MCVYCICVYLSVYIVRKINYILKTWKIRSPHAVSSFVVRGVGCREDRWVGKVLMLGKIPVLAEARDPRKAGTRTVFSIQQ